MTETVTLIDVEAASALSFSDSFSGDDMTQERDARLLDAGDYPDKGLTVTEADLDGIVARFGRDAVPVKVEHVDSPLDPLGQVRRVWREGGALMARLAFPPDLAGFLRRRGVQKLSVGLSREGSGLGSGLSLAEVSLVLRPRVASAAMFGGPTPAASSDPSLLGKGEERTVGALLAAPSVGALLAAPSLGPSLLGKGEEMLTMTEEEVAMTEESLTMADAKDAEIARLRAELTAREVSAQIGALKAAGRVVPATEGLARALLSTPAASRITLSEGAAPEPVAGVFRRFLEAMPPVVRFGDTAAGAASDPLAPDLPQLSDEEQAWLRDTLGLDPAQVLEMMLTGKLTRAGT